ncbi:M20/M25/M40 family metallo-hydrolase [Prescottella defluvii]|nr:M20/M25/M40 family metallo-hydrolase [Prescottella defluvii]
MADGCRRASRTCGPGEHRRCARIGDSSGGADGGHRRRAVRSRGIPTIIYGPGDTALAHSPDESIEEDEVVASAQVLARTLLALASRTTS